MVNLATSKLSKRDKKDLENEVVIICAIDMMNILSSYMSISEKDIYRYPVNIQLNYDQSLPILRKLREIFSEGIISLNELFSKFKNWEVLI